MIVKFHARGVGRGSGPVEYLLGKNGDRELATLDRGNPTEIQELIDSSPYAKKYTSGVLSFREADLSRKTKDQIMTSFEKALLPGLEPDQYSCLWVEHRDKGRLELNFVVPNVELQTGKRLQPYFEKADKPRVNAWKVIVNHDLKLHDPDDPKNQRELVTPRNLPPAKQAAAQAITDGLLNQMSSGEIKGRQDIVNTLKRAGFTITRENKNSISIADPDGGRNIRLKGMIYEQNFRFGAELQREINAARTRYGEQSEHRIQDARRVYQTGVSIKRTENHRRYQRPQSHHVEINNEIVGLGANSHNQRSVGLLGRDLVAGTDHSRQTVRNNESEQPNRGFEGQGREHYIGKMRGQTLHSRGKERRPMDAQEGRQDTIYTGGVLENDRVRTAVIERIRDFTETARGTAQGICDGLKQFNAHVQDYLRREHDIAPAGERLVRAGRELSAAAPAVRNAIQQEQTVERNRDINRDSDIGFHL